MQLAAKQYFFFLSLWSKCWTAKTNKKTLSCHCYKHENNNVTALFFLKRHMRHCFNYSVQGKLRRKWLHFVKTLHLWNKLWSSLACQRANGSQRQNLNQIQLQWTRVRRYHLIPHNSGSVAIPQISAARQRRCRRITLCCRTVNSLEMCCYFRNAFPSKPREASVDQPYFGCVQTAHPDWSRMALL